MTSSGAARAADILLRGFEDWHSRYRAITRRARDRFERRDWAGIHRDTGDRLALYDRCLADTLEALLSTLAERSARAVLAGTKEAFTEAILGRDDFELAQTFFNSVSRKLVPHRGLDASIDFLSRDFPLPYKGWEMASARMYAVHRITPAVVHKLLADAGLRSSYRDLGGDTAAVARRVEAAVTAAFGGPEVEALDVVRPLFIRNKAAYVVARARRGERVLPVVLALLHEDDGLFVDAVLTTEDQLSILFSFARWYFHAEVESPREVIGFLHSILPRKRIAELYLALGYNKHGKSEFFADLSSVIDETDERFVRAPGEPGMVMSVFTLPSYEFVFKVIRDVFPPPKSTTPGRIREKYRQVLTHDRVGRLVDFQEFDHLLFPRERFSDDLLEELLGEASRAVELDPTSKGDDVDVLHAYVGRRVTPLDVYLREHPPEECEAVVLDFGESLRDMAAANVFPGDLLLKNFGVTRHGRVVFYDYDELAALTDCTFRRIPPPRDPHDEMAAEPWFSVGEGDVFPEEFERFLELKGPLRELFLEHHGELLELGFWRSMQQLNRQGEVIDFFPYPESERLITSDPRTPEPAVGA
jgi:isocitrate dehydrogenase kinase/phosphatase